MKIRIRRLFVVLQACSAHVLAVALCCAAWSFAGSAAANAQAAPAPAAKAEPEQQSMGAVTEDGLKQMLVGKTFYLRGCYLDDSLSFNDHGGLDGHAQRGSYTLSLIEIERVHLSKHKLEIEGVRYGLHFLGALPYEDPTKAADKVRITPKKKMVRITIDRERVVKAKKEKREKPGKGKRGGNEEGEPAAEASQAGSASAPAPVTPAAPAAGESAAGAMGSSQPEPSVPEAATAAGEGAVKAAPALESEKPADQDSVSATTTSPAQAAEVLKDALDNIFASSLDERMMAAMPEFWKLYYQAVSEKRDYVPTDPAVEQQNTVDRKARLITNFEPESNQYAQDNGVAGMALYHVVVGTDGKPEEIAVGRPIGFGLDENAVKAIRNAKFEPAMKDGKPVPELVDLVVQFRIYSKRTSVREPRQTGTQPAGPQLPGPYSVQHPPQ